MSALGKLFRTTAFKLTLAYLIVFALFAAFLLGYFALNTRRLFTDQVTQAVDIEIAGLSDQYNAGGIRRLTQVVDARSRRPGSNLYLVTTPNGDGLAGNVGSLPTGILDKPGRDRDRLSPDRGGRDRGTASRAGARLAIAERLQASGRARPGGARAPL